MKDILFALSEMLLLGQYRDESDTSEAIWRIELMTIRLNTQSFQMIERQFLTNQLETVIDKYLK